MFLSSSVLIAEEFRDLMKDKSVRAGLCVVIGCDNENTLSSAQLNTKYLVQGLCTDEKKVDTIRKELIEKNVYGSISVSHLKGESLPYINNLVNVLVVIDQGRVSRKELMRVIAPYGVLLTKEGSTWKKITKPYPKEMDEWGQKWHDAAKTSLSKDALVAPPTRLQWLDQEEYDRESLTQLLSAGGRNFYTFKGGKVVARDAFNGTRLWEIENVGDPWIATKDYLCTVINSRLAIIDAATGKLDKLDVKLSGSASWDNGIVYTVNGAYSITTKKQLWQNPQPKKVWSKPLVSDGKVIFATNPRRPNPLIICRDAKTGKDLWQIPSLGTLSVCYRGKLLIKGPQKTETIFLRNKKRSTNKAVNHCVDMASGKKIWTIEFFLGTHHGSSSMSCVGDVLWVRPGILGGRFSQDEFWRSYDLNTGKKIKEIPAIQSTSRCFDPRATERFILAIGSDFLDHKEEKAYFFHGARGACGLGSTPANGMLYQFPNMCMCMWQIDGVSGVLSHSLSDPAERKLELSGLLEKGSAYRILKTSTTKNTPEDWTSLRGSNARWGSSQTKTPDTLNVLWTKKNNLRPSSPVSSNATVYVALRDNCTVAAFTASHGKPQWTFVTDGPIDSPPTLAGNAVVVGSEDGWVYVLHAKDGKLAWRFRAAPKKRVTLTNGRLASTWPLHGSLSVENGIIYAVAGHHNELDGGLFTYALELKSGKILWKKRIVRQGITPKITMSEEGDTGNTILASDGKTLYSELLQIEATTGKMQKSFRTGKLFFRQGAWSQNVVWGGTHGYLLDLSKATYTSGHSSNDWLWGNVRANMIAVDGEQSYGIVSLHGKEIKTRKKRKEALFQESSTAIFCAKKSKSNKAWFEHIPKDALVWKHNLPAGNITRAIIKTTNHVIVAYQTTEKNGSHAGMILLLHPATGKEISRLKINSPPLWDGLAAAANRLYLITEDNSLHCLGAK